MDWRAELIDLSQSEFASRLYYLEELTEETVGATGLQQCGVITRVLAERGVDTTRLINDLQLSIDFQLDAGVPTQILRRDFAALDAAMLELCEPEHRALSDYLQLQNFSELLDCSFVERDAPASSIAAACSPD